MTPNEMLKSISKEIWETIDPFCNDDCCRPFREIARKIDAFLAQPQRRCDVYDPEVAAHIMACSRCKNVPAGYCDGMDCGKCSFMWFTEKVNKRKDKFSKYSK